jgi:acetyl-CoA carboxylase biotin carboxyl carrier protein
MTNEEIKELLEIFHESDVAEMEVQRGSNRLRLRRIESNHDFAVTPAAVNHPHGSTQASGGSGTGAATAPAFAAKSGSAETSQVLVKSPIVGTYYDAPAPGAAPFVRVGDAVEPGQVLCIIESMKLMNEIEAEVAGTVAAKLVENGRPVEYGEALFSVRPR